MLWGFRPAVILPLPKEVFPKTSLGKIQRSLVRRRYEAGDFAAEASQIEHLTSRQTGVYTAPEGPLESAVAEIFARILGIAPASLSATASFFDLGGTSLDILKLTRALERRCGFKAGLPIVMQNPSVRQIALRISSQAQHRTRQYDPVVPLQTTGRKMPLFCVHPGNGEILTLVNVAKYFLNDRPFYALRAPGFNEGEEYFNTFQELLTTYVNAILKRQPQGPYAIAGYSFGCSIAFEIAKEFEARGNSVAFLGCIDGIPVREAQSLGFNVAATLALVTDLISRAQYEDLNKELGRELPSNDVCEYVLSFASADRLAELNLNLEKFSVWARVGYSMESLLYTRVNSGSVKAMTIFRSEGYDPRYLPEYSSTEKWRNTLMLWDDLVLQPRYVDVPGQHFTLMGPKHVAGFQAILRAEIGRALATH
jgi:thioesterase domain-containing protein/acyl carrier protein